jgi:hypothetical protein
VLLVYTVDKSKIDGASGNVISGERKCKGFPDT